MPGLRLSNKRAFPPRMLALLRDANMAPLISQIGKLFRDNSLGNNVVLAEFRKNSTAAYIQFSNSDSYLSNAINVT